MLFWGVREMKRLNLQTVDRPQVDIECAGRVIQSTVIANARRNPNFQNPVDFFDVVCSTCIVVMNSSRHTLYTVSLTGLCHLQNLELLLASSCCALWVPSS